MNLTNHELLSKQYHTAGISQQHKQLLAGFADSLNGCCASIATWYTKKELVRILAVIANIQMFREFEIIHWAALNDDITPSSEAALTETLLLTAHATKMKLAGQKTNQAS